MKKYLAAIAAGDVATAARLDGMAVSAENKSSAERVDPHTLRIDDVLSHAEQRISDVSVQKQTSKDVDDAEARRVSFRFTLDGKKTESSLAVKWDDKAHAWTLTQSMTVHLSVDAVKSKLSYEAAPFQIPGISGVLAPDPGAAADAYLVYPGVYRVTSRLPVALLVPGTPTTLQVAALPAADAVAQFDVTELPSSAGK